MPLYKSPLYVYVAGSLIGQWSSTGLSVTGSGTFNTTNAVNTFADTARYSLVRLTSGGSNQSAYIDFNPSGTGNGVIQRNSVDIVTFSSSGIAVTGGGRFTGSYAPTATTSSVSPWVSGTIPLLSLNNSANTADKRNWDIRVTSDSMQFHMANDAYSGSNNWMTLDSSGNLIVPAAYSVTTASAANCFVETTGQFKRSTSALKYKQDIRALEQMPIDDLQAVRYKSKCDGDDQEKDHIGIVADQANDAGFGDLVIRGADGEIEGFQYERLTSVLLNELQALRKRVAALESK